MAVQEQMQCALLTLTNPQFAHTILGLLSLFQAQMKSGIFLPQYLPGLVLLGTQQPIGISVMEQLTLASRLTHGHYY